MPLNLELLKRVVRTHTDAFGVPNWKAVKNDYEASAEIKVERGKDYYRIWWSRNGEPMENTQQFVRRLQRKMEIKGDETARIEALRKQGYNIHIWTEDGRVYAQNRAALPTGGTGAVAVAGNTVKIALVSDTHIGSKFTAWDALRRFYQIAYARGVRTFLHAGDMTDGFYKNRDSSFFEQDAHGFQEQLDMVVKNYPKMDGVITKFITGNHDVQHLYNGGADIGRTIASIRPDMEYLGHNFAEVWLNEKVSIGLYHPTDGSAYAISQKTQKIIDGPGKKSKIIAVGHYHKMSYIFYKNIWGITMPSFQKQTGFMRDNGLESVVGGIILTVQFGSDGEIASVSPEFIHFPEEE